MRRERGLAVTVLLIAALAVFGGWQLAGGIRDIITRDELREAARLENEHRARMEPWRRAGKIAAGVIGLFTLAGLGSALIVYAHRRAGEIRPGPDGQFPIIRVRVGGATVLHDPNRQLSGTVVYTTPRLAQNVVVMPVMLPGLEAEQVATTARAQAVQLASAVNKHRPVLMAPPSRSQPQPLMTAEEQQQEAEALWPTQVPLARLLAGPASLDRIILGVTVDETTGRQNVITDRMSKLVHVAVGGSSGWGKSVFLRALAYQIALAAEGPNLVLVDLEGVTFAPFARSNRLLYPVADTEDDALATLHALRGELDRRKALFGHYPGVDNLQDYNVQAEQRGGEILRPVIILVDEATALLADKRVEDAIRTLALRGRKYGLWLTLGGQDWKASSLDTAIRNQLASRVQFRAMSPSQSRVLLGERGAEALDAPGRALAVLPGRGTLKFQAPYVSAREILATIQGEGPQHPTPTPSRPEATRAETIRQLAAQGLSLREIQRRVFGYVGGAAYDEVKRVLEGGTEGDTGGITVPSGAV